MGSILFLVPYPFGVAPSQRYRFEQYLEILTQNGYTWDIAPFFNSKTWEVLYKNGRLLQKLGGTISGLIGRLRLMGKIQKYSWIFIHREAIPFGPPWYEWVLVKIFKKKIIYDFDDAIWITQKSSANFNADLFKSFNKTSTICAISKKVSAGNSYLGDYALRYNPEVYIIPTTINTDTEHTTVKQHTESRNVTIGWTGSHSTLPYLDLVAAAINDLENHYPIRFLVISNKPPSLNLESLVYKSWIKETEVADLSEIDIGLMPLTHSEWTKGKCGLKALQYMALGIPALVTPVGVNQTIVHHEIEGFHCDSKEDWYGYIEKLINNPEQRQAMGVRGRDKVKKYYSVQANRSDFLSLFSN